MSTEKEKMLSGEVYDPEDTELVAGRRKARDLLYRLNHSKDHEKDLRKEVLASLFGAAGEDVFVEPPFYCDYGTNIHLGDRVFFNFNCVVLDPAEVHIGSDVLFGPAAQVYTATHPVDWRVRRKWIEAALPVKIGSDVWIGGGAIVLPGVEIGDRTVVGAGSVVNRDLPPDVFAAGNPCRVIRELG